MHEKELIKYSLRSKIDRREALKKMAGLVGGIAIGWGIDELVNIHNSPKTPSLNPAVPATEISSPVPSPTATETARLR